MEGLMANQLYPLVNSHSSEQQCLSLLISINEDICRNAFCSFLILNYSEKNKWDKNHQVQGAKE